MLDRKTAAILAASILMPFFIAAQSIIRVRGTVTDERGQPLSPANVVLMSDTKVGAVTDGAGAYQLTVPAQEGIELLFRFVGYTDVRRNVSSSMPEQRIDVSLQISNTVMDAVDISGDRGKNIVRIDPKKVEMLPTLTGSGIEGLVKSELGVHSNSELSSQYSVRGGNFDENLVYINGVEVYRPFLVRSGQQEGLSIINPDMVESVDFSAGGFEAKYGDKMSSVLSIEYKQPEEFSASVSASLLGATAHVQGVSKNKRFAHTTGLRYKSISYILNSMETEGEYIPVFFDFQTYLTYRISSRWKFNVLGYLSRNQFQFIPQSRSSSFGSHTQQYKLNMYFDGEEIDHYLSGLGTATLEYDLPGYLNLRLNSSAYHSNEAENFDIDAAYWLNELSEAEGDNSSEGLGIGRILHHARNALQIDVYSLSHSGKLQFQDQNITWGLGWQRELIDDTMNEWKLLDSAGYSLPYSTSQPVSDRTAIQLFEVIKGSSYVASQRLMGFGQYNLWGDNDKMRYGMSMGVRLNYWDYSNQLLVSPRFTMFFDPYWEKDVNFRFAAGFYSQPAFYRELRNHDGSLTGNPKAQESFQVLLGNDINFKKLGRRFKFTSELYYKALHNIVPYEIDNVRIRYYADQRANGYSAGADFKLFGDFVPGTDSWISLSFMSSKEDIIGDDYYQYFDDGGLVTSKGHAVDSAFIEPGYIVRPSNQLMTFGIFFQDYIRGNESYKFNLAIFYGTSLRFGPPNTQRHLAVFKTPHYRRVDLGFSKVLKKEGVKSKLGFLNHFRSLWITAEVFNLLDLANTTSYQWVHVIPTSNGTGGSTAGQYAVPNRLTGRRLNVKLTAKF